jgi:zinc transport system ATP-binding protein
MTPVVQLDDVSVAHGGRAVLNGVTLQAGAGEVVAILGPNGSGKSTLIRSMIGLLPLTAGEVRLFGTPLTEFDSWDRVGYVPQRATAASGVPATVREVVASGRLSRRLLLRPLRRVDRIAIDEALSVVGMADRASDGVAQLSGGQQQRVLIARALVSRPDLFVLDEPTTGVDLPSQEALVETLRPLVARGATIVLVAHEVGAMHSLIDRAVVIREGHKVYDGEPPTSEERTAFHGHAQADRPTVHVPLVGRWPW